MLEALQTLANITVATDDELEKVAQELGREYLLQPYGVSVGTVIRARAELMRLEYRGDKPRLRVL